MSIYIFRYYFALPPNWYSRSGDATEAVYGFSNFLLELLARRPKRIACAFDESLGSCFRNTLYPDYKCSRALPDESLAFQLAACRQMAEAFGIASFASKRFEADDILATLNKLCRKDRPIIVSRDKDLGQLLDFGARCVWDFATDVALDAEAIYARFGVRPRQIADFLALVGDSGDDIPGVPGVGRKTAARLLAYFDDIEALLAQRETVARLPIRGAAGIARKLASFEQQIRLAKQLALLQQDMDLGIEIAALNWQAADVAQAQALAQEFGFEGLGTKIGRILTLHQREPMCTD